MKLATIEGSRPDGQLVVVSRDLAWQARADGIADTLQDAVERWDAVEGKLQELSAALNAPQGENRRPFDPRACLAPLPRAWQWLDGSAYQSHGDLMSAVFKLEKSTYDRPLMYQGMSHQFLSGHDEVPFVSEADGIDFEGEFGVIVDHVPMATPAETAAGHIRLITLLNDWSLRVLAPVEMKTGFGWIQAKPACSMAPLAVTPDELGTAWQASRVHLPLTVHWNGNAFGHPNGRAMRFSFAELIAHAAGTRSLCAGTILGSGTVSNENYREVGSTCIAERRGIETLDEGSPRTGYMKFGDEVRMQVQSEDGTPLFGEIRQRVVRAGP